MPEPAPESVPEKYREWLKTRGFDGIVWHARGGFGNVYKAMQAGLKRPVAIKFFDNGVMRRDPANHQRFKREAQLLARIQHPAVPFVITRGEVDDGWEKVPYTIMQFIEGDTLADRMRTTLRPMDNATIWRVMADVLGALDAVHQHEVIHRDVKPDNIIVSPNATYLIDFSIGISTLAEAGVTRATATDTRIGTPRFMAPEQYENSANVTSRVDIYSAGAVLAEMHGAELPVRLSTLDTELGPVDRRVRDIIRKACAKVPEDRFQTAGEMRLALAKALGMEGAPTIPPRDSDLTDDDACVVGVVLAACPYPGDIMSRWDLTQQLKPLLSDIPRSLAIRRLIVQHKFLELTMGQSERGDDDYEAIVLTPEGHQWAATHADWITNAHGMLEASARAARAAKVKRVQAPEPAPAAKPSNPDDDIPF